MEAVLTVALPVYNGAATLERALKSLAEQTRGDIRVLIIDNASTDASGEIARKFADSDERFVYCLNARNFGTMYSNMTGIFRTATPYYALVHADISWAPTYAEEAIKVLEADQDTVLAYSRCCFIDSEGQTLEEYRDEFDFADPDPATRYLNIIGGLGWCTAWHGIWRSDLYKLLFTDMLKNTSGNAAGDNMLLAMAALLGKITQIEKPLFFRQKNTYQQRAESLPDRYKRMYGSLTMRAPFCHFIKDHCDILVGYSRTNFMSKEVVTILTWEQVNTLTQKTVRILLGRYKELIEFEINGLIELINKGDYKRSWSNADEAIAISPAGQNPYLDFTFLTRLNEDLDYAYGLMPKMPNLSHARALVKLWLGRPAEARACLEEELAVSPVHLKALELKKQLDDRAPIKADD
ncbi:glycosyltransferase family 2 protein [Deltaproteobacteria bacterium OttesenSCG-928-K17]|nr:glycosyltransferase family 2 protein [Deltaproteobacteria bacterium OttesenSCG-928-K17]